MMKNIKRHIKAHPIAIILIIVSYIISILFISIGISFLNENKEAKLDNHTGDIEKQLMISIKINEDFEVDRFIDYLIEDTYDYDIKLSSSVKIGNENIVIIGHKYKNKPYWKPNLLSGSYFNNKKYNDENIAIIGKDLEPSCFFKDDKKYISINEEKYLVVGVMGREKREVIYNKMIYIPINYMTSDLLNNSIINNEINLLITSRKEITQLDKELIIEGINSKFNNITISNLDNDYEYSDGALINMVLISSLIFIVSIVNVMAMTLFWIMDRRKEIAVRKVLGFENKDIFNLIINEMITIGGLSIAFSMIIQSILNIILNNL